PLVLGLVIDLVPELVGGLARGVHRGGEFALVVSLARFALAVTFGSAVGSRPDGGIIGRSASGSGRRARCLPAGSPRSASASRCRTRSLRQRIRRGRFRCGRLLRWWGRTAAGAVDEHGGGA